MGFIFNLLPIDKKCANCGEIFKAKSRNEWYCNKCKKIKNKKLKCVKCGIDLNKRTSKYCNKCGIIRNKELDNIWRETNKKNSKKRYNKNRDNDEFRINNRIYFKKWYEDNKQKQKENLKKDYIKNKKRWDERKFVHDNKEKILKEINKICFMCGKEKIKEIHHKTYEDLPKDNIKEYCKSLIGFCSRECHRAYESKLPLIKKLKKGVQSEKCAK